MYMYILHTCTTLHTCTGIYVPRNLGREYAQSADCVVQTEDLQNPAGGYMKKHLTCAFIKKKIPMCT